MIAWRDLKVGVRLSIGLGAILGLLVISASVAVFGLTGGNAYFTDYRTMARQTATAAVMNGDLLTARLNVEEFLLTETDESIKNVNESVEQLLSHIESSRSLFQDSDEDRQAVAAIASKASTYRDAFKKVVDFRAAWKSDAAKLDEIGPKIESDVRAVMESAITDDDAVTTYRAGDALQAFMQMRLASAEFLVQNMTENAEREHKSYAE